MYQQAGEGAEIFRIVCIIHYSPTGATAATAHRLVFLVRFISAYHPSSLVNNPMVLFLPLHRGCTVEKQTKSFIQCIMPQRMLLGEEAAMETEYACFQSVLLLSRRP